MNHHRFPRTLLLLVLVLLLPLLPGCDNDPKVVDRCGDNIADPGEDCDGTDVRGQSCTDIGYYNAGGTLACNADCTFDVTDCGGHCGDDLIEGAHGEDCEGTNLNGATCASLNFTRGGTLACRDDCTYDYALCLNTCGDGNLEPNEPCDDADTDPGDGCSATCTVEDGWTCTGDTLSTCTPICPDGLSWCDGDCLDLYNDPLHCGGCDAACGDELPCIAGVCRAPEDPWVPAGIFSGSFPDSPGEVRGFDLGTCAGRTVLFLQYDVYSEVAQGWVAGFRVYLLDGNLGQWSLQPELVPELTDNYEVSAGMAVTCRGEQIIAAYSITNAFMPAPDLVIRVLDPLATAWRRLSATNLTSSCWQNNWMDMGYNAAGNLHILDMCHWYASHAVEYAWWDGEQWGTAPSIDDTPRLVAHPGVGRPSLAFVGSRTLLGVGATDPGTSITEHRILRLDDPSWTRSEPFDFDGTTVGANEDIAVAGNGLSLCAAWVEDRTPDTEPDPRIFVRCSDASGGGDPLAGPWLPAGEDALATPDHAARAPALVVAGRHLYMTYLARESVNEELRWHLRVMRRPVDDPTAWQVIGADFVPFYPEFDARPPQMMLSDGRLVLGFIENDQNPDLFTDTAVLHVLTP